MVEAWLEGVGSGQEGRGGGEAEGRQLRWPSSVEGSRQARGVEGELSVCLSVFRAGEKDAQKISRIVGNNTVERSH